MFLGPQEYLWPSFSAFPSKDDLQAVGIDLDTKCTFLLELLTACLAFKIWAPCVVGMNLVLFVDNEASKAALITGSSGNKVANNLLRIQARTESNMALIPWVSRVPLRSYIADHLLRELREFLPDWPDAGASL